MLLKKFHTLPIIFPFKFSQIVSQFPQSHFSNLFENLKLAQKKSNNEQIPLNLLNHLIQKTQEQLDDRQFYELCDGVYDYIQNVQMRNQMLPQIFWNNFIQKASSIDLQMNSNNRRVIMRILEEILQTSLTKHVKLNQIYQRIIEIELMHCTKQGYINLEQLCSYATLTNEYQKAYPQDFSMIGKFKSFFNSSKLLTTKILLNDLKYVGETKIQNSQLKEILSFMQNNEIDLNNELLIAIKQNSYQSLQTQNDTTKLIDVQKVNESISLLLKDEQSLRNISQDQKAQLSEILLKILYSPAKLDDNSVKKVIVLTCRLWPDQIRMISTAFKKVRENLLMDSNTASKDKISLCINALFQMQMVKYFHQTLRFTIIESYLTQIQINKDIGKYIKKIQIKVFRLNPQEISSLCYFLSKQVQKQGKKLLLGLKPETKEKQLQENSEQKKISSEEIRKLSKLFISIIPQIQFLCSRNQLRMKVIYTIVDCCSKYKPYLSEDQVDMKYLFEKIEMNLMAEMENEIKQKRYIEQKDIKFLYSRFFYLRVGSRKLHRFLKSATLSMSNAQDPIKLQTAKKPSFFQAFKKYQKRVKVYKRMQDRRKKSIFKQQE